jgi:predicted Zn-dependent protease with MMP-like domain
MRSDNSNDSAVDEWEQETAFAKKVVDDAISKIPENLRAEALRIGYEFLTISEDANAPDSMGGYCRSAQRIRLYLPVIKEQSIEDGDDYSKQLVITYLHEFGHHLGMEEEHLETWGL